MRNAKAKSKKIKTAKTDMTGRPSTARHVREHKETKPKLLGGLEFYVGKIIIPFIFPSFLGLFKEGI